MTRWLATLLTLALVAALVGCGGGVDPCSVYQAAWVQEGPNERALTGPELADLTADELRTIGRQQVPAGTVVEVGMFARCE